MPAPHKKIDYCKIQDLRLNKIFWALACALLTTGGVLIALSFALPIDHIVNVILFVLLILLFIAFVTVFLYNYTVNKAAALNKQESLKVDSPLTEAAKAHEQSIIDLMSSVIKPVPGKQTINTAKTAKFIKALSDIGLIDANLDSKHLMAWIENVTGYPTGETRVFNQALKAVKVNDPDLLNYRSQLEQIIGK